MNFIELIPNLHPIFVHFTVALLSMSTGLFLVSFLVSDKSWARDFLIVAHWNLIFGAGITVITIGTGLYEYYTVAHDDISHTAMTNHRNWAFVTGVFWIIALVFARKCWKNPAFEKTFLASLILASVLLMATGWKGGELVYKYGLGVSSLPQVGETSKGDSHNHEHEKENDSH